MANALKVPTSDLTFAEAKEKYAKKLKRMESVNLKKKDNWKTVQNVKALPKPWRFLWYHERYYFIFKLYETVSVSN